jgi:hypothetical protein
MSDDRLRNIQDLVSALINNTGSGYNYINYSRLLLESVVEYKKTTPEKISVTLYYS